MTDPLPFRASETGPEATLGRAVDAARQELASTPEGRAEIWWGICSRLVNAADSPRGAPARRRMGSLRLAAFASAGALGVILAALFVVVHAPGAAIGPTAPAASLHGDVGAQRAADSSWPCDAWTRLDRGDVGTFEFPSAAVLDIRELDPRRVVRLQSGLLRAHIVKQDPLLPLTVVTPQLQVTVLGTRFDVVVESLRTRIDLIEGRVQVESGAGMVILNAGESVASDDPRLSPPPTPPRASADEAPVAPNSRPPAAMPGPRRSVTRGDCDQERSPDGLVACLRQIASGRDLAAQSALFELGLLQRGRSSGDRLALETFAEYARRFPDGLLAPEVSLRSLAMLRANGASAAAIAEAVQFEARFPDDPRLAEVRLARADLECADPERRGEAEEILDRLQADVSQRAAVARVRERCAARMTQAAAPDSERPEALGGAPPGN